MSEPGTYSRLIHIPRDVAAEEAATQALISWHIADAREQGLDIDPVTAEVTILDPRDPTQNAWPDEMYPPDSLIARVTVRCHR